MTKEEQDDLLKITAETLSISRFLSIDFVIFFGVRWIYFNCSNPVVDNDFWCPMGVANTEENKLASLALDLKVATF